MKEALDVALALIELAVRLVGKEKAAELVSQTTIDEANAAADAIEAFRFRPTPPA